jgi:hypothetical protein
VFFAPHPAYRGYLADSTNFFSRLWYIPYKIVQALFVKFKGLRQSHSKLSLEDQSIELEIGLNQKFQDQSQGSVKPAPLVPTF